MQLRIFPTLQFKVSRDIIEIFGKEVIVNQKKKKMKSIFFKTKKRYRNYL